MNITYNVFLTMKVLFKNPLGRTNQADLDEQGVQRLLDLGYEIL